jgi:hypothetical protein
MILSISGICFYSTIYKTLFSLLLCKIVAYKYLLHIANKSIQIYFVYKYKTASTSITTQIVEHISLTDDGAKASTFIVL